MSKFNVHYKKIRIAFFIQENRWVTQIKDKKFHLEGWEEVTASSFSLISLEILSLPIPSLLFPSSTGLPHESLRFLAPFSLPSILSRDVL